MKRIGLCIGCKKRKKVEQRKITLPTGHVAKSHDAMCDGCYTKLRKALNPTKP